MGTDITAAENLRLKQIIEDQQRQIDAMVVGAGRAQPTPVPAVAQGPVFATDAQMATAKPTPTRDPRLSMLLDLAQRHRLCTSSQRQMMLDFVKCGRFSAQYYVDMWTRRLTDLSPQAAASVCKVLSAGLQANASSGPHQQRAEAAKDVVCAGAFDRTPPGSAPTLHRALGFVAPCKNSRSMPPPELVPTMTRTEADVPMPQDNDRQTGIGPQAQNAQDVKMEPAEQECANTEQEDQVWGDAPQELMRRATQTFVQEDESQKLDVSGDWRGKGAHHVELSNFKASAVRPGAFRVRRDAFEQLWPYQRAGVAWMAQLFQSGKGGILADEMGLGKTVQACTLLTGIRAAGATHALIIVPVTLLDQWDREASKWCPDWRVYTYHGSPGQRLRALQGVMTPAGGVLLTSYSVLKNADERLLQVTIGEADALPGSDPIWQVAGQAAQCGQPRKKMRSSAPHLAGEVQSGKQPWDVVICDEAHVMRNISTLLGKHLRNLRSHSRMLLTGTPVQNALRDLWSLMDFAQPGLLGNHATFVKNVSDPIDKGSVRGATPFAVQLKKHLCEQLWDMVKPHMLRRTKESVGLLRELEAGVVSPASSVIGRVEARLPPKLETVVWLMPTSEQVKATQKALEKSDVIQEANSKGEMGLAVFRAIALLKKLCNHPALGLPLSHPKAWKDFLSEAAGKAKGKRKACNMQTPAAVADVAPQPAGASLADGAEVEDEHVRAGHTVEMMLRKLPRNVDSLISQCAKLRCLEKMLPAFGTQGHRTLIFSQGLKMMDLVELCILKRLGITYLRIDGSTDVQSRADRVQQFQTQPDAFQCMLLTTGVGGYGLNLTGADRVVLLDPAWNPATDAQAVDRVYRIGQKREVRVYRLVMSGLIEDKMFRLQVFKMGLTKTVLEAKQQQRYFTSGEIRGLFEWTDPSQGETRKLLLDKHGDEQENVALVNAHHDGAQDWLEAGPAVGISNFSMLYSCLAHEDMEPEDECEAQVVAMKAKLASMEENQQRTTEDRKSAEEQLQEAQDAVQDASRKITGASVARTKAAELMRQCQAALAKARRREATATQDLEKAARRRAAARGAKVNAEQAVLQASHETSTLGRAASEACAMWNDAMHAVDLAFNGSQDTVAMVQQDGKAAGNGNLDGSAGKAKAAQKSLERAQKAWDAAKAAWASLESAEDAIVQVDSSLESCQKEYSRLEAGVEKAIHRAESARDAAANAVATLVEVGVSFAEALQVSNDQHLSATFLKVAQQAAKSTFRQVASSWSRMRQLQEAWAKACSIRRRAVQKAFSASAACAKADACLETVEADHQKAVASQRHELSSRLECEQAMLEAEGQRSAAEVEDAALKCRRSEGQTRISIARAKLKPAKFAEKEASAARAALLGHYSKADKVQIKTELEAETTSVTEALSAVKALCAEEYDKNQVEDAYQAKKKQRSEASSD